jgi:cytochrome oxidase Cu insertion factor (SCO1/SenC/PrrC family)
MKKTILYLLAAVLWLGCGSAAQAQTLGPTDGRDLPATDLERVAVGRPAPDFILTDVAGKPIQLSSYRDKANVVLVFYRGHW